MFEELNHKEKEVTLKEIAKVISSLRFRVRNGEDRLRELRRKRVDVEYVNKQNETIVSYAQSVLPLMKVFKMEKDRLVYPDGHRLRLGKARFEYRSKIENPDAEYNGIRFAFSSDTNLIEYAFEVLPLSNFEGKVKEEARKAYNFYPERDIQNRTDKWKLLDYLRTKELSEIEATSVYGIKPVIKDFRLEEDINTLNRELSYTKQLIGELSNTYSAMASQNDLFDLVMEVFNNSELTEKEKEIKLSRYRGRKKHYSDYPEI
tara:strand:- start:73462 stop:74244 length:783 start_codon:yes stop_codon:yes gene_type:complete